MTKQITNWFVGAVLAFGLLVQSGFSEDSKDGKETQKPKVIIGSTQADVDVLLKGWTTRKSDRSTTSRPIIYYVRMLR